jgi:uncharacterized protein
MKITVSHIPPDGLTLTYSEKSEFFPVLADLIKKGELKVSNPVKAVVNVQVMSEDLVEISGEISTVLTLECGRCLTPFDEPLKREFTLGFVKHGQKEFAGDEDEDGIEIREDDIETEFFTGDVIELKNTLQEQVVMGLPLRPLCSESCNGLCQSCGTNLNQSTCTCIPSTGHPAFAVLKGLKK